MSLKVMSLIYLFIVLFSFFFPCFFKLFVIVLLLQLSQHERDELNVFLPFVFFSGLMFCHISNVTTPLFHVFLVVLPLLCLF